jgi:putative N6-adenine-specific DNA methylase
MQQTFRGLHFNAGREQLYRIVYCSRLSSRILAPLMAFRCHAAKYLYRRVRALPWEELFSPEQTFAVSANVANSRIRHSRYASLCLKDAVVDHFRDVCGCRPDVDRRDPDIWLNLHIHADHATVALDLMGRAMHKRGYRLQGGEAPMQETLAAAIIQLSGWNGERPLVDFMCGSGTLPAEALMRQARIPAAFLRPPAGLPYLPDYAPAIWQQVKEKAHRAVGEVPAGLISCSDRETQAVAAARQNLSLLPQGKKVRIQQQDFHDIETLRETMIVCNPPYGIRMQAGCAEQNMRALGDFLKQRCTGSSACIYFGEAKLLKHIGLKPAWKKAVKNAGLDGRLAFFELY